MEIVLCAFRAEEPAWHQLAASLPHMNRSELEVSLSAHYRLLGDDAPGLLLYHVLKHDASMARDPRRRRVQLISFPSAEKISADGGDFLTALLHQTGFTEHAGIKNALLHAQEIAELASVVEGGTSASAFAAAFADEGVDVPVDGEEYDMMRD